MRKLVTATAALATTFALALLAGPAAAAGVSCDLVASPYGSDSASGSASAPFRSVQKLVDSLSAGQTGCLRGGSYNEAVRVGHGGSAGSPIALTSYPGESATVVGRFWVAQGADHVTVTGLKLDGRNADNLPSPTVNANHVTFASDDVTNDHTAICFVVGSDSYGTADGTLITKDRIHGCGVLPAANHDHGIYVEAATNTRIEWNLIYDNADRGIQLYPNAQQTTIDHNIIDANGEGIIFSGDSGAASSNANVYDNVISNARIRHDAESYWPAGNPVGTGNSLHDNCVWGGREGTIDASDGGFSARHNTTAAPQYLDASAGNYHMASTSSCLAMTGDIAAVADNSRPIKPSSRRHKRHRPKAHASRRHRHRRKHHRRHRRHHRRSKSPLRHGSPR